METARVNLVGVQLYSYLYKRNDIKCSIQYIQNITLQIYR